MENCPSAVGPIDLVGYSTSSGSVKTSTQSTGDIFGGSQSTVIDLNDVAATPDLARDRKDTVLGQPLVKKRKITIISDAEKAKYDRRKLAESLAASQPAASRSTCPSSDHSSKCVY